MNIRDDDDSDDLSDDDELDGDGFDVDLDDPRDDDADVEACPQCGVMIHEDSVRCPACGEYVTFGSGLPRKGLWWWTAWLLLATVVVLWLLAG